MKGARWLVLCPGGVPKQIRSSWAPLPGEGPARSRHSAARPCTGHRVPMPDHPAASTEGASGHQFPAPDEHSTHVVSGTENDNELRSLVTMRRSAKRGMELGPSCRSRQCGDMVQLLFSITCDRIYRCSSTFYCLHGRVYMNVPTRHSNISCHASVPTWFSSCRR